MSDEPTAVDYAQEFIAKQWCQHDIRQPLCGKCLGGLLRSYGRSQLQPVEAQFAELLSIVDQDDPTVLAFLKKHGLTKTH
jgi:hypothetical protein